MGTNSPFDMREPFQKHKGDIAFLIGNGINRYCKESKNRKEIKNRKIKKIRQKYCRLKRERPPEDVSWEKLLLDIWREQTSNNKNRKKIKSSNRNQKKIPKGISLPEFSDLVELRQRHGENPPPLELQASFCKKLGKWEEKQTAFQKKIVKNIVNKSEESDIPILTTNFDDLMPQSIGVSEPVKLPEKGKRKNFISHYPWASYYRKNPLTDLKSEFAIWHIHGMKKYHLSIMLSFSHYITKMAYIKKRTRDVKSSDWEESNHIFSNTWLDIFYHKRLFIFGLGLDEQEVFLRWLLIQRAKHKRNNSQPPTKFKPPEGGWYVMPENEKLPAGKKLFLESVGIQICKVKDYEAIYETPWK